jgi:hypothetical protein
MQHNKKLSGHINKSNVSKDINSPIKNAVHETSLTFNNNTKNKLEKT